MYESYQSFASVYDEFMDGTDYQRAADKIRGIILQYGHGTGTGGWVQGRDYINPAIQPVFDEITEEAWREVTNL